MPVKDHISSPVTVTDARLVLLPATEGGSSATSDTAACAFSASLCQRPYPGHPKGCPNFGQRATCPPRAWPLGVALDLKGPLALVAVKFNLAGHVAEARIRHPDWSERQLRNSRHWQGSVVAALRHAARDASCELWRSQCSGDPARREAVICALFIPEAHGVDVTATCKANGIDLEWPPESTVWKVALVGVRR